jgi:hypothetical protein
MPDMALTIEINTLKCLTNKNPNEEDFKMITEDDRILNSDMHLRNIFGELFPLSYELINETQQAYAAEKKKN